MFWHVLSLRFFSLHFPSAYYFFNCLYSSPIFHSLSDISKAWQNKFHFFKALLSINTLPKNLAEEQITDFLKRYILQRFNCRFL